jgi:hypothetical protein
MAAPAGEELFPEGLRNPSSVLFSGTSRSLLKWVAFASLARYSSRVFWTDLRLSGEILDPLDPMARHVIPEDVVDVLPPGDLRPEDQEARLAEAASATMFPSDEAPESVRGIIEFIRMPWHTQQRISAKFQRGEPTILVCANADRLVWAWGRFSQFPRADVSPPDFVDYRDQNRSFARLGAFVPFRQPHNWSLNGSAQQVQGTMVTADFFDALGAQPLLGRLSLLP